MPISDSGPSPSLVRGLEPGLSPGPVRVHGLGRLDARLWAGLAPSAGPAREDGCGGQSPPPACAAGSHRPACRSHAATTEEEPLHAQLVQNSQDDRFRNMPDKLITVVVVEVVVCEEEILPGWMKRSERLFFL